MKHKMPNEGKGDGKYSDTDSGSMGSNKGASTGLKITPPGSGIRADTGKAPSSKNLYPDGMA